ncbi:MAG TPA: ABC transporter substrate-binding protein, partial [Candidatus Dormibacteraeota bacterium]
MVDARLRRPDFLTRRSLGVLAGSTILLAACGQGTSSGGSTANAATAQSASDMGGLSALVSAAKKEGQLNAIALPPDWANYGAVISGFTAKYGIKVNSANPNGSSQDEVTAVQQLGKTSRAPDVLDVGMAVALANTSLFAPYKVQTWNDILDSQKEPTGIWYQDYGGYMSVGYDSAKVPAVNSLQDLMGAGFRGKVA